MDSSDIMAGARYVMHGNFKGFEIYSEIFVKLCQFVLFCFNFILKVLF